jgi:prevent-host-death family protein
MSLDGRGGHVYALTVTTLSVGIKDLKTRLSEYVGRTREGERFLVTDRGEPVAELIPLSPERQALAKLAEQGAVEWQGGKPKGLRGVVVRGEPVSETILRDRR